MLVNSKIYGHLVLILFRLVESPGIEPNQVGVDNADLKDTDLYIANTRKAWNRRALVIIKSKNESGTINLKVSSQGLNKISIKIQSIREK